MALHLRYAAASDVGLVRTGNEDAGYAGPDLLVVADGMGGHAAGEIASAAAVQGVLSADADRDGEPGSTLRARVARAGEQLRELVRARPELEGMGTTLTMLAHAGDRVGVAQVGDSRAYLLRQGVLELVTHDQTFVQSLVDEGRISDEEARSHPQRSVLLQAVDGRVDVEPVIEVRQPVPGDRYLLCSDGLSGVVSEATIRDILADGTPQEATERLVDLALRAGAPDNVTVVVADVVDDDEPDQVPVMVGAAAEARHRGEAADEPEPGGGDGGPSGGLGGDEQPKGRHVRLMLPVLALLVLVVGAGVVGYRWTQNQYYVGVHNGNVVIYRGVPQAFVGRSLSHVVETTDVPASALPSFAASQAHDTIAVGDLDEAHRVVQVLRVQAAACAGRPAPAGCPPGVTAVPSASPSATVSPSSSPSTATGSPGPSPSASVPVVTGPTP